MWGYFTLNRFRVHFKTRRLIFTVYSTWNIHFCDLAMYYINLVSCCCSCFLFIFFGGLYCTDRYKVTCTATLEKKHTQTHLSWGLSPAGGGLLPNLQAGWLYLYSSNTHWLELAGHTHTAGGKKNKNLLVSKSIFQLQLAFLKIS